MTWETGVLGEARQAPTGRYSFPEKWTRIGLAIPARMGTGGQPAGPVRLGPLADSLIAW